MEDSDLILDIDALVKLETIMAWDKLMIIAASFLGGLVARSGRIAALAASGDLGSLGREAHDLKSTAGSFGARRLQYLGEQLEAACRDGEKPVAGELADAIMAILPETRDAMLRRYPEIDLGAVAP